MSLVESNILERKVGLPWQHIQGQALILNPEKHEAHELNEIASLVWSQFDGKKQLTSIIKDLAVKYDVEQEELKFDVLQLAQDFVDLELASCL